MGTVDVIMAGRVSSADVGGVGIGASIWLPLVLFGQGLLLALPPTISYLNGSGQRHRIAHQVKTRPLDFIFSDDSPCTDHLS